MISVLPNPHSPSIDDANLILPESETIVAQDFIAANFQLPISAINDPDVEKKQDMECEYLNNTTSASIQAINSGCRLAQGCVLPKDLKEENRTSVVPKPDVEEELSPFPTPALVFN